MHRLYQWILARAASPRAEWWLAFLAFADGGLFPFPPHPLLGLMCLAEPKKALRYGIITTAASILGGLVGYAIGHFMFNLVGEQLLHVLGLSAKFPKAACYLRAYGAEILIVKGVTPIPFMLMTLTAGFISFPLPTFIGASLISRGAIFMTLGTLFKVFGAPIKAFIDKYFALVAGGVIVLILSGYIAVSMLGGGTHKTSQACDAATSLHP